MILRRLICLSKAYFNISRFCQDYAPTIHEIKKNVDCPKSVGRYPEYLDFSKQFDINSKEEFARDMTILEDFVSEAEEASLIEELTPVLNKLHYEFDHWDDAIHGYRETEKLQWNDENMKIINRVRKVAFPPKSSHLSLVHVLDLAENGHIKPHIDSVRFCGDIIAGISLLSSSVMRLVHEKENKCVDVLLSRRSLYIMTGTARYDYTHELLGKENSTFKDRVVTRGRRLSIICRNEPVAGIESK